MQVEGTKSEAIGKPREVSPTTRGSETGRIGMFNATNGASERGA